MTVITISRQFGSGGDEIAQRVCEILGFRQFDKRLIEKAAAESGISEQEIIDYSEENHKVRSFLDRLFDRTPAVGQLHYWKEDTQGVRSVEVKPMTEDVALSLVQNAIHSAVNQGNLVILGRGGQVLLQDTPSVLHVRVIAPMEDRIQRLKWKLKIRHEIYEADIGVRRNAQDVIEERDAASADYIKRFYQRDWDDPTLYHVTINTGKLTIEQAARLIAKLAEEIA